MKAALLLVSLLFTFCQTKGALPVSNSQKKMNHLAELRVEHSPVFAKPPLYYYHLFLKNHEYVNPNVPLKEHYGNERQLRLKKDALLNKIDALTRKKGFVERDISHAILKIENDVAQSKEQLHNVNVVAVQRETAVKFEINHDMMWNYYYKKRLGINQAKLAHALPDQITGKKRLIKNDKGRMKFYKKAANEQYQI